MSNLKQISLEELVKKSSEQTSHFSISIPPPPLFPGCSSLIIPDPAIPPPLFTAPTVFTPPQFTDCLPFMNILQSNIEVSKPYLFSNKTLTNSQVEYENEPIDQFEVKRTWNNQPLKNSASQEWVNNWLQRKRSLCNFHRKHSKTHYPKMYIVREKLNIAFRLIKELENGGRTLSVMLKTVTPSEWSQKCDEIESKKVQLSDIFNELKLTKDEFNSFKEKMSKRSKKQDRKKRQVELIKKQQEKNQVRCQNLHYQIDKWQQAMQEEVERSQREDELGREADAVLWVVTHKKSEALHQLVLMTALLELRHVRFHQMRATGKPISHLQIQTFNTVVERLQKMWKQHLNECLLEEQALRGMLSDAEIKEDPVKTHKKLVLQEWETALFGSAGIIDSQCSKKLLAVRCSWDQFAVQGSSMVSSNTPPGWILPVPPSNVQWQSLLKY